VSLGWRGNLAGSMILKHEVFGIGFPMRCPWISVAKKSPTSTIQVDPGIIVCRATP
jgi:hypothetical protein